MSLSFALFTSSLLYADEGAKGASASFECAHSQQFCFDRTGEKLVGVTQRGELLFWPSPDAAIPVVIPLDKKLEGNVFHRMPMGAAFNADGPHVMLFYYDGRVQLWDVVARRKVKDLPTDRTGLSSARRSPDGKRIACVSRGREGEVSAILFWNTQDWSPAGQIESNDPIGDFCFTPDSRQVLLAVGYSTDRKNDGFTGIVAWDIEAKKDLVSIEYGGGFPIRIAMSSDGRWVATGGGDAVPVAANARRLSGHLRIFDWKEKKLAAEPYTLPSDYVRALTFSPDGQRLYSGSYTALNGPYQASVRCFSAANNWKEDAKIELGPGNPHEMSISPDGRRLLVPDTEGLKAIDADTRKVTKTMLKFRFYPEDEKEVDKARPKRKR